MATEPTTGPKLITHTDDGWLDHVRTAIFALQLASELTRDEEKLRVCREVITDLQAGLAEHAKRRNAGIFTEPQLPHVDRIAGDSGAE